MNAYELATGLENHFKGNFITSESALLLRQQADRIAELEKWEERWSKRCQRQQDRIAELEGEVSNLKHINKNWQLSETMAYNRIAELEKLVEEIKYEKSSGVYDVSSKPVAWMQKDVLPLTYIIKAVVRREADEQYTIPLYTHPVKQLSDEEIFKAEYKFMDWNRGLEKPLVQIASELFVFRQALAIIKEITE